MSALLIDIGNTRLKWAWCTALEADPTVARPWQFDGAIAHEAAEAASDFGQTVEAWRALASAGAQVPSVWIANVAGEGAAARATALVTRAFGDAAALEWVRTAAVFQAPLQGPLQAPFQAQYGDLINGYREPTQLGVDRWVGAIGAHRRYPDETLLLVTAGTATTLDIVSAHADAAGPHAARFEGGLILPGLALMLGSLARNTAQLPSLEGVDAAAAARVALGADNTHDAIAAGCLAAQTGAIAQTWRALAARGPVRCVVSGGARHALAGALAMPYELHDNLVLLGLHAIALQA
ncbi:type III pantothenate kinase [Cupriavidus plantarum]|uniref:type III pantothenate kinase n=1 Tax=Cupriavidus plantarum TaxID=942865 RepID=UPI000E27D576|nr:type III pantothenate kinase [Cupriavidus plantarum]REE92474.1 type III pantothenate kinase [Cupriavidus plantarum]